MRILLLFLILSSHLCLAQNTVEKEINIHTDSQLPPALRQPQPFQAGSQALKGPRPNSAFIDSIYTLPPTPRRLQLKTLILPTAMFGYGLATIGSDSWLQSNKAVKDALQNSYPNFQTRMDDYTRYVPLAAVYGLNLAGVKGKHNLMDVSMLFVMSSFMSRSLTTNLKKVIKEDRPDKLSDDSFPSQHTASAFAKAELLRMEYKDLSPWYGVAGYSFAVATGGLRMLNNRHWFSDVVAGAGIGILSTRVAYLLYPFIQDKIVQGRLNELAIAPFYQEGAVGLGMAFKPGSRKK